MCMIAGWAGWRNLSAPPHHKIQTKSVYLGQSGYIKMLRIGYCEPTDSLIYINGIGEIVEVKTKKVFSLVAALLVVGTGPALAAELPPDLAKAVREYDQAQIHSDIPALARLFADDYMLVNSDASVENK